MNLRRSRFRIWILGLALGIVAFPSLQLGPAGYAELGAVFRALGEKLGLASEEASSKALGEILLQLRAPRLVLGWLAGADLAVAGLILQTLFLNPLADAYVVGVSAGASLGAVAAFCLGFGLGGWGLNPVSGSAFVGALLALLLVFALCNREQRSATPSLLLAGLCVSALTQSVSTLLLLRSENTPLRSALGWLMGSLAYRNWGDVQVLLPASLLGIGGAWMFRDALNLLAMGSASAHHLGLSIKRTRLLLVALAALLASAAVSVCGLIGFVGLVVPNLLRLWNGPNHRALLPLSALGGALLLTLADLLNRLCFPSEELPVGIVTGVLGGLFLLRFVRVPSGERL